MGMAWSCACLVLSMGTSTRAWHVAVRFHINLDMFNAVRTLCTFEFPAANHV